MSELQIWLEDKRIADGHVTAGAIVEGPDGKRSPLWYRVPEAYEAFLTTSADPFVIALVFSAMRNSADLVVHGAVSPSLLANLEEFIAAWSHWNPALYDSIRFRVEKEQERQKAEQEDRAIAAFSGGVDAAFTVYRHVRRRCGRLNRRIGAGLMVHGFDIGLEEQSYFDNAYLKGSRMLESLGIPLIPMATNFRDLGDRWTDSHGAALASCLSMLSGRFSLGLIASTEPYRSLVLPWGSNPITDPLLSSNSFQIIHDGAAFTRSEKIGEIADWPEALQNLRVCWQGEEKDRNCGECEKCIRTILNFRVMGLPTPACFESDVLDDQIRGLSGLNPVAIAYLEEILQVAHGEHISASWVKALHACVKRNRRWQSGWRLRYRQLRNDLALRSRLLAWCRGERFSRMTRS